MESEKIFYNSLAVTLKSDYKKLEKLKEKFGNWESAWNSICKSGELFSLNATNNNEPMKLWGELSKTNTRLILRDDPEYPNLLKEIPLAPHAIYVRGKLPEKEALSLAIVGTRKVTPDGEEIAYEFGKFLAGQNITIVSGLALGADSAAHRGALKTGRTVAVLATGVDNPYPHMNKKLAQDIIVSGGALISEYPICSTPFPSRFLERNRIVSGLSKAIVVVEAPENSGSLVTARFALVQNREVFVVPGPAGHSNYKGSHALIREGARLVSSPNEILEDLNLTPVAKTLLGHESNESGILSVVQVSGPLEFDEIVELTKLETATVNRILSTLLIDGRIKETSHGYKIT